MKTIDLAFCCDDDYAQHLGVALCSALHNLARDARANVFILHGSFSDENKKKIFEISSRYGARVSFISVDPSRFTGLKITHYVSAATYYRFSLPDLLPPELEKVLYLDSDITVLDDLTKLWDTELGGKLIAAVPEPDQRGLAGHKEQLGIPQAAYFNAGVLLIDLAAWRARDLTPQLFAFARDNHDKIRWWDQDAMNYIFHGAYRELDYRWNFTPQHLMRRKLYGRSAAAVVHFLGGRRSKPWCYECGYPFMKKPYFKYLKMTPWSGFKVKKPWIGRRLYRTAALAYRKLLGLVTARAALGESNGRAGS